MNKALNVGVRRAIRTAAALYGASRPGASGAA